MARLSWRFRLLATLRLEVLQPRLRLDAAGLGSFRFARHYSGNRCFLSLPAVIEMFQFSAFALSRAAGLQPARFPHSDVRGSFPVCRSPRLFAAYHVLRRLRKPRHPPFALVLFVYVDCLTRTLILESCSVHPCTSPILSVNSKL